MKNNQFAIANADSEQALAELQAIHFLTPAMQQLPTVPALYQALLEKCFPEALTPVVKRQKLANLMATNDTTLADWLTTAKVVSNQVFYNVALQLLQFRVDEDFKLNNPAQTMVQVQLPMVPDVAFDREGLAYAWYLLLNTHTKNGQTLLDNLATRGYFKDFYDLPADQKPVFFNGKAQPVFDTQKLVREVVYVEAPLDTDEDGKRDLLKVEVLRPAETNQQLKVPVIYTASPYNQGINDLGGEALMHDVNVPLHQKTPNKTSRADVTFQPTKPKLPAARTIQGESQQAEETFSREQSYALNDYFLARGFAVAYAAGIGSLDSDGIAPTGSVEETVSTIAVIEWLAGNRTAFTNRETNTAITAWWCSGKIAMTGRSYLGTLATAAATTGVKGLKTVISEAAISSWYDYYRDNGLVVAPDTFQGEDTDVLAEEVFSRQIAAGDYHQIQPFFAKILKQLKKGQDRTSGDYNRFWDERNYLNNLANIKADMFLVHGLNDWNVKPRNVANLWAGLRHLPVTTKLVLHQGQHIYINNFRSLDFTDMVNLWLSNELWDVQNGAKEILPPVLVQDNVTPETWHAYQEWWPENGQSTEYRLQYKTLVPADSVVEHHAANFSDELPVAQFGDYQTHLDTWQQDLLTDDKQSPMYEHRLIFKSAQMPSDQLLRGIPRVHLKVATNKNYGLLSCMLVDYGEAKRLTTSPVLLARNALDLGYHWREDDLKEFKLNSHSTPFKMITKGHINLQNRHHPWQDDEVQANEFYEIDLNLQPTFYHLTAGHQLGLVVYSTDMRMTVRGNENLQYSLDLHAAKLDVLLSDYQ